MYRLRGSLLVVSLAACTSASDYRAMWCERFCAGGTSQTCLEECPSSEGDAGTDDAGDADAGVHDAGGVDAGAVDAGAVDAGEVDAGELDAGVVNADAGLKLVLEPLVTLLSAGICTPMSLSMQASDGSLVAGEVTLVAIGASLEVSDTPGCTVSARKVTVTTSTTQPVSVFLRSASVGHVSVTLSSPQAQAQPVGFDFRARVNATSDNLDAGCTTWRARLVSIDSENAPVIAVGEVLNAPPSMVWADTACMSSSLQMVQLNLDGFTTFQVKQGDEVLLSPVSPFIAPVQLIATPSAVPSTSPCRTGAECQTRSCSAMRCACIERGSPAGSALECCSTARTGQVCK